jgi:hypothetical protein
LKYSENIRHIEFCLHFDFLEKVFSKVYIANGFFSN